MPVTAVGCHPGVAATELFRHVGFGSIVTLLARPFINTAPMGAWPTLQAATGKVTPGGYYGPHNSGGIRGPSAEASRAPQARNPEIAQRLWDVSIAMTGIDPGLPPVR